jgi:ubiquinone/menaquinone biosynthesis C-methylase UbiE
MPYRNTIAAAYNAGVEEELNRLTGDSSGKSEYNLITGLLDEYISNESVVIDIGSGPGRYAEHLLKRDCKVGVVDLSARSLKAFSDRMTDSCCKENIIFNRVSCATQLDWVDNNSADAILLMGPLYHLINKEHRNIALSHCKRILKSGGYLFSVFLSPFPLTDHFGIRNTDLLPKHTSLTTYTNFQGYEVPQFRCWPDDVESLMNQNNLQVLRFKNLDKPVSSHKEINSDRSSGKTGGNYKAILHFSDEQNDVPGYAHQYICVSQF